MIAAMSLHRPPRYPHAWIPCLLLSQLAVAVVWWRLGWAWGLPAMLLSHLPFLWGTLKPDSRMFSPVLRRLPGAEQRVWLTIDDGPSDDTAAVLDLLDRHRARATFFVVGERAQQRPELVREIVRRGHGIGNHSQGHPQAWFWALGPHRMREQVAANQATLAAITGTAPRWFRAVVGMANPFVAAPLREHGLARVAWSARGFDALASDPQTVVARIERDLAPGAIVLLHEGAKHGRNVDTLALLLQRLDALGYGTLLPEEIEAAGPTVDAQPQHAIPLAPLAGRGTASRSDAG
ncbi:polysaccharide deacetylase family protein [Lysobacter terrestris]|uniref:Polysaccharide deacetylase family protein n=1 Tax=Agrilutibacter terrestris TaxID=2865112 RepID=A0A7H0G0D3_9GAMM|nr:polysaccharide deacetylase family protein [Lysobacter terrestris]